MVDVDQLLGLSALGLERTHVPHGDVPVRWVATSELADPAPYLQGSEVLLTTGLGTEEWGDEWASYVTRLVGADVAALGFGVGLTHETVPDELVDACREHALNLFTVPRPTAFVAVSRAVATLLDEEREHAAQAAVDAQRALTSAALEPGATAAVLARLGVIVRGAAAVVGRDGRPRVGPHGPRAADLDTATVRDEVARIRSRGLRAAASASTALGTTVVHPIGVRSRPEAWLCVFVPGRLSEPERVAVGTAVALLGLAHERRTEQRAAERARRSLAIERLLAGDPDTAQLLLATSSDTTTTTWPAGTVRVLRARGRAEVLVDLLGDLEDQGAVAALHGDDLVVVAAARASAGIAATLGDSGVTVGIGTATEVEEAARSHDTAARALASATSRTPVRSWDDLQRGGVLSLLGEGTATYATEFLAPLLADDALLETLETYLEHHGAVGPTAEALGVHRNTVRNRLGVIEGLLGRRLDDAGTRVDAWVALAVLRRS